MRSTAESIVRSLSAKHSLTNVLFTMCVLDFWVCIGKTILSTHLYDFRGVEVYILLRNISLESIQSLPNPQHKS